MRHGESSNLAAEAPRSNGQLPDVVTHTTREMDLADLAKPRLPATIGPFAIERLLGSGGMGAVYLGRDESGQRFAVKVLPTSLADQSGLVERFTRESEALRKLKSPHIVRLFGRGHEEVPGGGSFPFFAMEYVDGPTLGERIRDEGRLPWREVVEMGRQVCRALKTAHNAGIIHRDLKPSNLLLTTDDDGELLVKLTDFGVAQMFAGGRLTVTGGMVGTAEYMSPEQADGRRVTKQSDLYSLGAVLYAAATGRPPFSGTNPLDVAQKHRAGVFDAPRRLVPELPRFLDEVICECLEKQPEDRPPDAYVLQRRLEAVPKQHELSLSESGETRVTDGGRVPTAAEELGGTLVAEIIREELVRDQQKVGVRRLLDSTWVLVGLLALVVGTGFVMLTRGQSLDAAFERGRVLIESEDPEKWAEAADEFRPIRESGDLRWISQLAPYEDRLELAEATRPLSVGRSRIGRVGNEPGRLLLQARTMIADGNFDEAQTVLNAMRKTLTGDETQDGLLEAVDTTMLHLIAEQERLRTLRFIEDRLQHARSLAAEGQEDSAEAVVEGLRTLYPDRTFELRRPGSDSRRETRGAVRDDSRRTGDANARPDDTSSEDSGATPAESEAAL